MGEITSPIPEDDLKQLTERLSQLSATKTRGQGSALRIWEENLRYFDSVLETTLDPSTLGNHVASAMIALCWLIQVDKLEYRPLFLSFFCESNRWHRCLEVFLKRTDSVKDKVSKSLFTSTVSIMVSYDEWEDLKLYALDALLKPFQEPGERQLVKPAVWGMTHLLERYMSHEDFLKRFQAFSNHSVARDCFLRRTFYWATYHELTPSVGRLLGVFLNRVQTSDVNSGQLIETITAGKSENGARSVFWALPLLETLRDSPDSIVRFKAHLFPILFKQNLANYHSFLQSVGLEEHLGTGKESPTLRMVPTSLKRSILFTALQVGKETGLIIEKDDLHGYTAFLDEDVIHIRTTKLVELLFDISPAVRLCGLGILTSSTAITREFSPKTLKALRKALPSLIIEPDAGIRGEMLSAFSHFVNRIRACTFVLARTARKQINGHISKVSMDVNVQLSLDMHKEFLEWLVGFFIAQLRPGSGYQNHIFSLKALLILINSELDPVLHQAIEKRQDRWVFPMKIHSPALLRLLQDLVLSAFEDVRSLAASTLEICLKQPGAGLFKEFESYLDIANTKMSLSGRADHADGVSRLYSIYSRLDVSSPTNAEKLPTSQTYKVVKRLENSLDTAIDLAKSDLAAAITKFPLHGIISSLRFVLDSPEFYAIISSQNEDQNLQWSTMHSRIITTVPRVWECVRDILCNDAPEGHVPEDLEDEASLTTKDILSYSWRAVKELSILIKVIVSKATIAKAGARNDVFRYQDLDLLTHFSFNCLTQLRHRGAFSAAAQAFASCCTRNKREGRNETLTNLYISALQCIQDQGSQVTRRSAGIPPIIVGILCADPNGPLFSRAMTDLQSTITTKLPVQNRSKSLPQVHALNCLKAIFVNTILGPSSEPYIVDALNVAGDCLTSNVWAIRNCGLMLFRALIDRLLGNFDSLNEDSTGQEGKSTRISWLKYPNLQKVILELLDRPISELHSPEVSGETVFPALKLIQRVPPPEELRAKVRIMLVRLSESAHWLVRDMAGQAISMLVSEKEDAGQYLSVLLDGCAGKSTNRNHGRLLCARYILKKCLKQAFDSDQNIRSILAVLKRHEETLLLQNNCPFVQIAFMELHILILQEALIQTSKNLTLKFDIQNTVLDFVQDVMSLDLSLRRNFPIMNKTLTFAHVLAEILVNFSDAQDGNAVVQNSILLNLSQIDSNACTWVLRELIGLERFLPGKYIESILPDIVRITMSSKTSQNHELISVARDLIDRLLDIDGKQTGMIGAVWSPIPLRETFLGVDNLPPSRIEVDIKLWSKLLTKSLVAESNTSQNMAKEAFYVLKAIRTLLNELMIFPIRYAAVQALHTLLPMIDIQGEQPQWQFVKRVYFLLIYDSLNDDDEEIRELAAKIVSGVLSRLYGRPTTERQPISASMQICKVLSQMSFSSKAFQRSVIRRMTGAVLEGSDANLSLVPSASTRFKEVIVENHELFMVEKQNLYIDDVRESNIWRDVLKKQHLNNRYAGALNGWVLDGVRAFYEHIKKHADGPLGWSSKADTFALIIQIINGAHVILHHGMRSERRDVLLQSLVKFYEIGKTGELHPILLGCLEKVISSTIIQKVRCQGKMLNILSSN